MTFLRVSTGTWLSVWAVQRYSRGRYWMAGSNKGPVQLSLHLQWGASCLLLFLVMDPLPERQKGECLDAWFNFKHAHDHYFSSNMQTCTYTHTDSDSWFSSTRSLGEDQTLFLANGSEDYGSTAALLALLQHIYTEVVCVCVHAQIFVCLRLKLGKKCLSE